MLGRKSFVTVLAIFLVLLVSLPAHAQVPLVPWHFTGDITYVNPDPLYVNPWGIALTSSVSGIAEFRPNFGYYGPDDPYWVGADGGSLEINIGPLTFGSDDDPDGPFLSVDSSNVLHAIGLSESFGSGYQFFAPIKPTGAWDFTIRDGERDYVRGTFNYSEVPIPGAVWLLGSGLIGLMGLRRRSRKS